jgi:hypothetical protein
MDGARALLHEAGLDLCVEAGQQASARQQLQLSIRPDLLGCEDTCIIVAHHNTLLQD